MYYIVRKLLMGFWNWMPTCYMSKYSTPLLINLVSLCWQSGVQVEMNVPIHSRCSERDFDPLLLKTQRSFKKLWMFKVHKFLSIILRSTFKMVDIVKDKIFFFFEKCRWGGLWRKPEYPGRKPQTCRKLLTHFTT